MNLIKFKTRFDRPDQVSMPMTEGLPSKTKQSFKDELDINTIIKKAQIKGQFPEMLAKNPQFGDFSNAPDYQQALNIVILAERQFEALNSEVRDRFQNDPAQFLEFVHNPENKNEMVRLGLATERIVEPKPQEPTTTPPKTV